MVREQPVHNSLTLRQHQEELLQLSELAGIKADPTILKIIIELLNMRVPPHAIHKMLKGMRRSIRARRNMYASNQSFSSAPP